MILRCTYKQAASILWMNYVLLYFPLYFTAVLEAIYLKSHAVDNAIIHNQFTT